MIIDLAKLGNGYKAIDLDLLPDQIGLDADGAAIDGPVHLTGEIDRAGSRTRVRGTITGELRLDCTRCLEPMPKTLDVPFEAVFIDSDEGEAASDREIGEAELVESLAAGGTLDIAEVVREQILLELPEQVFCKDDCKGLCPKCGGNLNLIDCNCENDEIDPRWAALKNMK